MALFSYIGRDNLGRIDRGTLNATSAEDARETLRKRGLTVDQVLETAPPVPIVPTFTPAMPWTAMEDKKEQKRTETAMKREEKTYIPFVETLRLFAGWLLAWYAAVFLIGEVQMNGHLPFQADVIDALFISPLVLRFTFATFLFLLFTSVHRAIGRGIGKGLAFTIAGVMIFGLFHVNVP